MSSYWYLVSIETFVHAVELGARPRPQQAHNKSGTGALSRSMPPSQVAAIWKNEELGLRCIHTSGWYQVKSFGPPFERMGAVGVPKDMSIDKLARKFKTLARDVVEDIIDHVRRDSTLHPFLFDHILHFAPRLKHICHQTHVLAIRAFSYLVALAVASRSSTSQRVTDDPTSAGTRSWPSETHTRATGRNKPDRASPARAIRRFRPGLTIRALNRSSGSSAAAANAADRLAADEMEVDGARLPGSKRHTSTPRALVSPPCAHASI